MSEETGEPRPHRAQLERRPREVSIHAKREFRIKGELVEAPAARVTLLEDDMVRVEWGPVYDPTVDAIVYRRCRVVRRRTLDRQTDAAAKRPPRPGRDEVERNLRLQTLRLIREREAAKTAEEEPHA